MASNRERLQAHKFLVQRATCALVTRETDPEQPPFRLPGVAAFASIGLAVIALVATGVFGLIFPGGNTAWQDGESVIVEKETGTRYVYLDGRLHPVANYSSALLAIGQHAETISVSSNSLAGVPRGPRIGVADAPDALPAPDRLLDGGWTLCSRPSADLTGAPAYRSSLLVGQQPAGGTVLGDGALLVEVPETGEKFLIAGGYRHRINDADAVTVGLALGSVEAVQVAPAIVDLIPAGQPIGPIAVPGAGRPSTAVQSRPDLRAGQLLVMTTSGGARQHFLAETDRLRPITALEFDIQLAYQPTVAAYPGREPFGIPLSPLAVAEATQQPNVPVEDGDPPASRPRFPARGAEIVCLTFDSGSFVPRLTVDPGLPPEQAALATPRRTDGGVALADEVLVPAGSGAVVEVMSSPDSSDGTLAVVTDLGRIYPLSSPELLDTLNYSGAQPVRLPAGLVAKIPRGPGLERDAAMRQW